MCYDEMVSVDVRDEDGCAWNWIEERWQGTQWEHACTSIRDMCWHWSSEHWRYPVLRELLLFCFQKGAHNKALATRSSSGEWLCEQTMRLMHDGDGMDHTQEHRRGAPGECDAKRQKLEPVHNPAKRHKVYDRTQP